jgi:hypothetical protein
MAERLLAGEERLRRNRARSVPGGSRRRLGRESQPLDDAGDSHAEADAHRGNAVALVAALQLV